MTPLSDLRRIAEAALQDYPDDRIMNAADAAFVEAFSPAECLRLLDRVEAYQEAGEGVLAAFDAGAFVRDIRGDGDPAWGIKLFPHLRWLAKLTQLVRPEPAPRPEPGETPHA